MTARRSGKGMHGVSWSILAAIIFILVPALVVPLSMAQEMKPAARSAGTTGLGTVEAPIKVSGVAYRSDNRRDPFLNPLMLKKEVKDVDEELSRGLPPPGISGTYIAQAVLQGTSIRDSGRMAIVRGADTRAYFLKEGDKLFDGYLKTIGSDSITLVRETRMKSGKKLTQEVTKRLRTP